jgi:hypothetical protein
VLTIVHYCFSGVIWKSILLLSSSSRRRSRLEEVYLMKQSLHNDTLIKSRAFSTREGRELFRGNLSKEVDKAQSLRHKKLVNNNNILLFCFLC